MGRAAGAARGLPDSFSHRITGRQRLGPQGHSVDPGRATPRQTLTRADGRSVRTQIRRQGATWCCTAGGCRSPSLSVSHLPRSSWATPRGRREAMCGISLGGLAAGVLAGPCLRQSIQGLIGAEHPRQLGVAAVPRGARLGHGSPPGQRANARCQDSNKCVDAPLRPRHTFARRPAVDRSTSADERRGGHAEGPDGCCIRHRAFRGL